MKQRYSHCIIILFSCLGFYANAQNAGETKKLKDYASMRGYVKNMQVANFASLDSVSTYNFIHNRLNFKFYLSSTITAAVEIRNRVFYGEMIQNTKDFGKYLDNDNGLIKLSKLIVDKNAFVAHSEIDRLWLDWSKNKWSVRLGRQRINWGKSIVWNPNDLFNTFNYANFDYEEQPGSDAVKFTYFPSGMSAIEVAIKPSRNSKESVAAAVWRFNQWNYDFQLLGGRYNKDFAFGGALSGNIKNAGLKAEATYFKPTDFADDTSNVLSATISMDYSFKNGFYINFSSLYNRHPIKPVNVDIQQAFSAELSPKNLMPGDLTFFVQCSKPISPILQIGIAAMYGISPDFLFTMPSITYSLSDNWDLSLIEQGVFISSGSGFDLQGNSFFLRLKWGF